MVADIELPTAHGPIAIRAIQAEGGKSEMCLVIFRKPWEETPFLRLHSSCIFSESLGCIDCDCALQLQASIRHVAEKGGAVVYLFQEGRGVGILDKIRAIGVQQQTGVGTAEAYRRLGHAPDVRNYEIARLALSSIDFPRRVRLATNNPNKEKALVSLGYEIVERVDLQIEISERVRRYLAEKEATLGHYVKQS